MKYNKKIPTVVIIGLVTTVGTIAIINGVNKEQPEPSLYVDPTGEYSIYDPGIDYLGRTAEDRAEQNRAEREKKQKVIDDWEAKLNAMSPEEREKLEKESQEYWDSVTKGNVEISVEDREREDYMKEHSAYVSKFNSSVITIINNLYNTQYETTKIYDIIDIKRKELLNLAVETINSGKLNENDTINFKAYIINNYLCVSENEPLYTEIMEIFRNTNEEDMTLINDFVLKLNF